MAVLARMFGALASLRFTLVILALLAAGILVALVHPAIGFTWTLVVPLTLFSLNLGSALGVRRAFWRQPALLAFHVSLLAIVLLAAAGRMTYLKGHVELSLGEEFSGRLTGHEAGPWHPWHLEDVRFSNEGFTIRYVPGPKRDRTVNHVRWQDEQGVPREGDIGDTTPLVLRGYRFYTSFNKGYAPTFDWLPRQGGDIRGTVHLPSYPMRELNQAQEWRLPGLQTPLWTMLLIDETVIDPTAESSFRIPERHRIVMRVGSLTREMVPGDRMELPQGVLVYEGLRTWMGYRVFYDWTIPWLLLASVAGVLSLAWHFWSKYANRPWQEEAYPEHES